MKKFLICLALLLGLMPVFAQNEISFIYLNGSNTNTEQSREDFIEGVKKLHGQIISNFNKDEFIKTEILKNGIYQINESPIPFYWGDFSKHEIEFIKEDFDFLKAISPKPANYVRQFIAMCLHDAIWVSKMENMHPIVNKLHEIVKEEYEKGNKVVLVGYSAGTFIVHQYLFLKAPVINLKETLQNSTAKEEFKDYVFSKDLNATCADAVFKTKLVTYDIENTFVLEEDFESFKEKIDKLNDYTSLLCANKETLAGGINYASPFALFYSEIFNEEYKMSEIMALSYKYIVENNMFWLTVNYSDDPLGFPMTKNVTFDKVKERTDLSINPNGGFIYDKSDISSRRTFLMAHLSYFKTAKRYAKILTEAINEGYAHFYMTNEK